MSLPAIMEHIDPSPKEGRQEAVLHFTEVCAIEAKIFQFEGVRIVIRSPSHVHLKGFYDFAKCLDGNFSIACLQRRLKSAFGLNVHDYLIVDGRGQVRQALDTTLSAVRASYQ